VTVRIALISDQHGNDLAFATVVDDIERIGVDRTICLGDVAQGGAQPAETLDRLGSLGCETVLGNADAFLLGADVFEQPTPAHLEVRDWTLSQLDERHLEQLRSFAPSVEAEAGGHKVLCFHGSPGSYDDVLLPESEEDDLGPWVVGADVLAGGHTHKQWSRKIGGALFVNPGSVGVRYDHHQPADDFKLDPVAEYAILFAAPEGPAVEFRRLPYSLEELRRVALASGRPGAGEHLAQYRAPPR
jgi:putative phosphoesterase